MPAVKAARAQQRRREAEEPAASGSAARDTAMRAPFRRLAATKLSEGGLARERRPVAAEVPVALTYNGISHVVMMITPADVADFAVGFSLAEGVVDTAGEIDEIEIRDTESGLLADLRIPQSRLERALERRRNLVGQTGCGLCGVEDLDEAIRPLPPLQQGPRLTHAAAYRALESLRAWQPLNADCGAIHAAAFADWTGAIQAAREDVGRHNAFDKLTGHMARTGLDPATGFIVLTSRCSYELVHKAIAARTPALMTVSAPTGLAVELAQGAGLTLIALARSDSMLCLNDPYALFPAGDGAETEEAREP